MNQQTNDSGHVAVPAESTDPRLHTATPWKVRVTGGPINGAIIEDAHGRGYFSGIVHAIQRDAHPIHGGGVDQREAEANAAFIVRAVNARDDLVSVLQEAIYEITHLSSTAWDGNYTPRIAESTVNRWRSVLAKAGAA